MPDKIEEDFLTCTSCKKEYKVFESKREGSKFCSKACKNEDRKSKAESTNCKFCGKKTNSAKKKFCNRECYDKSVKKKRIDAKCESCGIDFQYKESTQKFKRRFCSKQCQLKSQSAGLVEIPSSGRMGFRKDLNSKYFFKSALEADYARWCEATNKPYIYEHKTFTVKHAGKEKQYTPDFYHPDEDKYVETKAIRRDRKYNSNLLAADILASQGLNIEVLLMSDFYRQIKQSGHYWSIDNIENKNYLGTKHLIYHKKKVI